MVKILDSRRSFSFSTIPLAKMGMSFDVKNMRDWLLGDGISDSAVVVIGKRGFGVRVEEC